MISIIGWSNDAKSICHKERPAITKRAVYEFQEGRVPMVIENDNDMMSFSSSFLKTAASCFKRHAGCLRAV